MEPEDVAAQLPDDPPPIPQMDVCSKCGNKYADGEKCIHWHCDNFDEQYSKTMEFILFKNGVQNLEDLKRWIDVWARESEKEGTTLDDMAAWYLAYELAQFAEKRTYDVAFLHYHGLPALKGNRAQMEEDLQNVMDAYSGWDEFKQELIDFMEAGYWNSTPS